MDGGGGQLSDHKEKWEISFASNEENGKKGRGKEAFKAPKKYIFFFFPFLCPPPPPPLSSQRRPLKGCTYR